MYSKFISKIFPLAVIIIGSFFAFDAEAQLADIELLDFIKANSSSYKVNTEDDFKIIVPGRSYAECRIRCEEAFDLTEKSEPLNLITYDKKWFSFLDPLSSDASNLEVDPFCSCFGRKIEVKVPPLPEKDPELEAILNPLFACSFSKEKFEEQGDWRFNFTSAEIPTGMALYTPLSLGTDAKAGLGLAATSNFDGFKGIVGVGFEFKTRFGPISFVCGLTVEPSDIFDSLEGYIF
jgi:hypothetical protein